MSTLSHRSKIIRVMLFSFVLALILFGWWLAQASFEVQPSVYAPLAVKNLSPKRGSAGITYVSDYDYLGVTWFYNWGPDWPWLFNWDAPGNSYGANPHNAYQFVPMLWCWWYGTDDIPSQYRNGPVLLWNEPANPGSTQCGQHYLGGPNRWDEEMWPARHDSVWVTGTVLSYVTPTVTIDLTVTDPLTPNAHVNWAAAFCAPDGYTNCSFSVAMANTTRTITLYSDVLPSPPPAPGYIWTLYSWGGRIGSLSNQNRTITVSPATQWDPRHFPLFFGRCPPPGVCDGWLDLSVRVYRPAPNPNPASECQEHAGKYLFGDITAWSSNTVTVAEWLSPIPG